MSDVLYYFLVAVGSHGGMQQYMFDGVLDETCHTQYSRHRAELSEPEQSWAKSTRNESLYLAAFKNDGGGRGMSTWLTFLCGSKCGMNC